MQISFRNYFYGAALMACVPLGFAGVPGSSIDQEAMQQLKEKAIEAPAEITLNTETSEIQHHYDRASRHLQEYDQLQQELKLTFASVRSKEELVDELPANKFFGEKPASRLKAKIGKEITPAMAKYFYTGQWIHDSGVNPELSLDDVKSIGQLGVFQKRSEEITRAVGALEKQIEKLYSKDTTGRNGNKKNATGQSDFSPTEKVAGYQFSTLETLPGLRPLDILKFTDLIEVNKKLIPLIYDRITVDYSIPSTDGGLPISCRVDGSTDTFDKSGRFYDVLLRLLHLADAKPIKISSLDKAQKTSMKSIFILAGKGEINDFSELKEQFALKQNYEYRENKQTLDKFTEVNNRLEAAEKVESTFYFAVEEEESTEIKMDKRFFMLSTKGSQLTVGLYLSEGLLLAYRIPEENNAAFLAYLMGYLSPAYTIQKSEDKDEADSSFHLTFKNNAFTFRANTPDHNGAAEDDEDNYPAKKTSCSCNCLSYLCSGCKRICSLMARGAAYPFSAREPRVVVEEDS